MNNSTFAYLTFKQRQAVIRMCGKETPCSNCLILAKCSQVCDEFTNFLDRKIEEQKEFRRGTEGLLGFKQVIIGEQDEK